MAVKQSEVRQQKALAAEEDRRRLNLLSALTRDQTTTTDDSESFCECISLLNKKFCFNAGG